MAVPDPLQGRGRCAVNSLFPAPRSRPLTQDLLKLSERKAASWGPQGAGPWGPDPTAPGEGVKDVR